MDLEGHLLDDELRWMASLQQALATRFNHPSPTNFKLAT
jgi:hypothetical protein